MATGKGIAVAQQVPLWGVSTLAALAHGVKQDAQGPILSLIDARRGQGYARRFDFSQSENAFGQAQAIDPQELPSLCEAVDLVVGNGLFLFDEVTSTKPPHRAYMGPTGHGLLEAFKERCLNGVPDDEQISLVPEYVRAPDAKMPRSRPTTLCRLDERVEPIQQLSMSHRSPKVHKPRSVWPLDYWLPGLESPVTHRLAPTHSGLDEQRKKTAHQRGCPAYSDCAPSRESLHRRLS